MELAGFIDDILVFTLGLARFIAIFAMMPFLGRSVLVGSARNAVAISFAVFIYPVAAQGIDAEALGAVDFSVLLVKEIVIGILIGVGIAKLYWAVEAMGFLIDNQRGSTMASSVDPLTGSQTSPLGLFMMQVVTVWTFISGAFMMLLLAIYQSYVVFPVASFFPSLVLEDARFFLGILDQMVKLAAIMASPALVAMFLSEFALGLVSRFAPQLNVFFLAMPVKSAVGMLMLTLYLTLLVHVWESEFALMLTHFSLLEGLVQ
ncbi:MAG: type III secretion system export apparatus subunit SctT [Pseudomonadota bacterium]